MKPYSDFRHCPGGLITVYKYLKMTKQREEVWVVVSLNMTIRQMELSVHELPNISV